MNNRSTLFAILRFCLVVLVTGPLYAQTPDPQYSSDEDNVRSDVLDVVESAVQDLSFLLSLQSEIAGNQPLLRQLKNDYYPMFDQSAIAYLTIGKNLNKFSRAQRDYLSCLIGVRFFNNHLNIFNTEAENNIQFEIDNVRTSTSTQIVHVAVSYIDGAVNIPIVVRLTDRGKKSNWQVFDVVVDGIGILNSIEMEIIDAIKQPAVDGSPVFKRITNVLNEKNKLGPVASEQWCKFSEHQSEPKNRSAKIESNENVEINKTLNGKSEKVYVEVTPTGTIIYQDDIILNTNGDLEAAVSSLDFSKLRLWDNAVIPYLIDRSLSEDKRTSILDAIKEFEKKTPVRFTQANGNDKNLLMFRAGDGCRSSLGMIGGMQYILLGERCSYGAVLHEIGHALGFVHEHNRDIRDSYVSVNLQNVQQGKERNFYKHPSGHPVTDSYCYSSIMHYSQHAFAIAPGYKTIEVKSTSKIGQRKNLSSCDADRVRQLYAPLLQKSESDTNPKSESESESAPVD